MLNGEQFLLAAFAAASMRTSGWQGYWPALSELSRTHSGTARLRRSSIEALMFFT